MTVEAIDADRLRSAASAARAANEEQLVTDAMQDRQPSEPPPLYAQLVAGHKMHAQWRYHLTPTSTAPNPTPLHTHTYGVRQLWKNWLTASARALGERVQRFCCERAAAEVACRSRHRRA
eukprot:3553729-Pleurochrysis_carterae.AAC.3